MLSHPLTVLVTVFALFVYVAVTLAVGRARMRTGVKAPAMDGPEEFQRAVRVQMNTLEQLAIFLPALWLFALAWGDGPAALVGVLWPLARIVYARTYMADPAKRGPGFGVGFLATMVLLVGAALRAIERLL
jgi:glutathione S-transferase